MRLAVPVDDRARRVVAHPARALRVRRHEPVQQTCVAPASLEHVAAEPQRGVDSFALGRLKVDREPLLAVLAEGDGRVVVVVRHREEADPVPELPHRVDEALPQNGPSSSPTVVAKAIRSWIVGASITKPPSSSCWCFRQCAEIG